MCISPSKDGATWNTASLPAYGNATDGTKAPQHGSHAWRDDPTTHDAPDGRSSNWTGKENCLVISVMLLQTS